MLFPDSREIDDHLDGLLHVLDRNPFEPRVKILLARKDVRRREAHERKAAAVGAAANRPLTDVEAASTNRFCLSGSRTWPIGGPMYSVPHM